MASEVVVAETTALVERLVGDFAREAQRAIDTAEELDPKRADVHAARRAPFVPQVKETKRDWNFKRR